MKKILIVGDSLAMPRYQEGVSYDSMYSTLLAARLRDWLVINGSLRANNSKQIISASYKEEYILPLKPNVVILQIGVVDCLPRLMSNFERRTLRALSFFRSLRFLAKCYVNFKSKRRLYFTRKRQIHFVDELSFERNLIEFRSLLHEMGCSIVAINIPCPGPALVKRTYGVDSVVCRYNRIIETVFSGRGDFLLNFYAITKSDPTLLQDDGYHIRKECHGLICAEIFKSGVFSSDKS